MNDIHVFPRPASGLRSDHLLAHMRAEHRSLLREQLAVNGYDAARVSHDWLADVHSIADRPAEVTDVDICGCTGQELEAGRTCGQDICPNRTVVHHTHFSTRTGAASAHGWTGQVCVSIGPADVSGLSWVAPLDRDAHDFACKVRADVHASLSPDTFHSGEENWSIPGPVADATTVAGRIAYDMYLTARDAGELAGLEVRVSDAVHAAGVRYLIDSRLRCDTHRDVTMTPSGQTYVCARCAG